MGDEPRYPTISYALLTFGLAAIWPVLGAVAASSLMDRPDEVLLLLGGITGILLIPLALLFELGNVGYGVLIAIVWLAAWLLPVLHVVRGRKPRRVRWIVALSISALSFVQALLGAGMLAGKYV